MSRMFDKAWNWLAATMFILVVAGGAAVVNLKLLSGESAPMVIHSVRVEPYEAARGEAVTIVYNMTKREACQTDIDGFWLHADGSTAVRLPRVRGGYSPVDPIPHDVVVRMRIPHHDDIGNPLTGEVAYRALGMLFCASGTYSVVTPDARFRIRG